MKAERDMMKTIKRTLNYNFYSRFGTVVESRVFIHNPPSNRSRSRSRKGKLKKKTSEFKCESVFSGGVRKGQNLPLKKSKLKHLSCSSTVDINQNLTFKTSRNLNKRSQREFVSDCKKVNDENFKRVTTSIMYFDHNLTTFNTSAIRNSSARIDFKEHKTPVIFSKRLLGNLSRFTKRKNTVLKRKEYDNEIDREFEGIAKSISIRRKRYSESEKKLPKGSYIPSFTSSMKIFPREKI